MTMRRVLAIEPDRRQAVQLKSIARRLNIELLLTESAGGALASLDEPLPDLILTPALLSCRDDLALTARLRELGDAAAHIQTLTIPMFETAQPPARSGGILAALWREKTEVEAPSGRAADMFADEIRVYLRRAHEARQARAHRQPPPSSEAAFTTAAEVPVARPADPAPQMPEAPANNRAAESTPLVDWELRVTAQEADAVEETPLPVDPPEQPMNLAALDAGTAADIVGPDQPTAAAEDAELPSGMRPPGGASVFGDQPSWFMGSAGDRVEEDSPEMRKMLAALNVAFATASVDREGGAILTADSPTAAADEAISVLEPEPPAAAPCAEPLDDRTQHIVIHPTPAARTTAGETSLRRGRRVNTAKSKRRALPEPPRVADDSSYFDPAQCRLAALIAKFDEIAAQSQASLAAKLDTLAAHSQAALAAKLDNIARTLPR